MFIPVRSKYTFKEYPNAPKATAKSRVLGMINSWLFLAVVGLLAFCLGFSFVGMPTDNETFGTIAGIAAAIAVIILIKVYSKKRSIKIDEMAVLEAEENLRNPPDPAEERRKTEKGNGIVLSVGGVIIVIAAVLLLPYSYIPADSINGSDVVSGKVYYVDNLEIIDSYAEYETDNSTTVYSGAVFMDCNGQRYMVSFELPDDETDAEYLSGYFKSVNIPERLESYYEKLKISKIGDNSLSMVNVNFRYICEPGKNITVDALFGGYGVALVIGLVSIISGILKLKRYR